MKSPPSHFYRQVYYIPKAQEKQEIIVDFHSFQHGIPFLICTKRENRKHFLMKPASIYGSDGQKKRKAEAFLFGVLKITRRN